MPWIVFFVVFIAGFTHACLYAFSTPPWALEDEEQHVDYVLTLRDTGRAPNISATIRPSIVASAIETDRYRALGIGVAPPPGTSATELGLEGLSYEGHQPPLYYAAMVPFAAVAGKDPLTVMYVLRIVGAALVGVLAVLTAWLASLHVTGRRTVASVVAGVFVASLPVVAEAGARASNDVMTAVLFAATVVAASYLLASPTFRRGLATGVLGAAAVLTKSTALALIVMLVALLVFLARRRRLRVSVAVAVLAPPVLAAFAWALVTHARYGVWSGDSAFLRLAKPFHAPAFTTVLSRTFRAAAFPYGEWGVPLIVPVVVILVFVLGWLLAIARPPTRLLAIGAALVTTIVVAGYLVEVNRGITTTTARLLVPAYPIVCAAAACGYTWLKRRGVAYVMAGALMLGALVFFVWTYVPAYPFRVG